MPTKDELTLALTKADAAARAGDQSAAADARKLAMMIRDLDSAPAAPAPVAKAPPASMAPVAKAPPMASNGAGMGSVNPMVEMGQRAQKALPAGYVRPEVVNQTNPIVAAQRAGLPQANEEWIRQREAEKRYNDELAAMNAASPIPFKNTGPDGPLELNQERPDLLGTRAFGQAVNANIGAVNSGIDMAGKMGVAYGAGLDPSVQGALAGMEYYRGEGDAPERLATAVQQSGAAQQIQQLNERGDVVPRIPIPEAKTAGEVGADIVGTLAGYIAGPGKGINSTARGISKEIGAVPGLSRTVRGVGGEAVENAAHAYAFGSSVAPEGVDRNMAGLQVATDPLSYIGIEALRTIPRGFKAATDLLTPAAVPTNAGGANLAPAAVQPPPATAVPPTRPAPAPVQPQPAAQAVPQPPAPVQTATAPPIPPQPPVPGPPVVAGMPSPAAAVQAPPVAPTLSREEARAADLFIRKLEADGLSMDDIVKIRNSMARRGDSGVYETSGELAGLSGKSSGANLRGLQMAGGAAPGPLQEALVSIVNENAAKMPERLSRGATRATGQKAENAVATLDELDQRLKTEAGPLYDAFYDAPVDARVYDAEIAPVLNAPHGQAAMERAARGLGVEAASLQARVASGGASPKAQAALQRTYDAAEALRANIEYPQKLAQARKAAQQGDAAAMSELAALEANRPPTIPPMALDHVKRAFDDLIDEAGQATYTGGNLRAAKRNFAESVSNATGGAYGNALGTYEGIKRLEDAFDTGLNALTKKTWELERDLAKGRGGAPYTGGEVEALAMGVARHIEDLIETNDQAALTKLLKGKALKNMATALGSEKAAKQFEQSIRRLAANREWGRRVAGGSDTAMRQAAIRDAGMEGEDTVTRVLDRVESSGNTFSLPGLVNDIAVKPIARTGKKLYQQMRYPGVYDEGVNRALIPLIATPMTPKNLDEIIRIVEARQAQKGAKGRKAAPVQTQAARGRGKTRPGPNDAGFAGITPMATLAGVSGGAMAGAAAPAESDDERFLNALFGAGIGGAGGLLLGGATKLSKPRPAGNALKSGPAKAPPAMAEAPKAPPAGPSASVSALPESMRLASARLKDGSTQDVVADVFTDRGVVVVSPSWPTNAGNDLADALVGRSNELRGPRKGLKVVGKDYSPNGTQATQQRKAWQAEKGPVSDATFYHGTTNVFDEFNGPTWLSREREYTDAFSWATKDEIANGIATPTVIEAHIRGRLKTIGDKEIEQLGYYPEQMEALKRQGFDGVESSDQVLIFDPKDIRRTDAKVEASPKWSSQNPQEMADLTKQVADRFIGLSRNGDAHVLALTDEVDLNSLASYLEANIPSSKQLVATRDGGEIAIVSKRFLRDNADQFSAPTWEPLYPSYNQGKGLRPAPADWAAQKAPPSPPVAAAAPAKPPELSPPTPGKMRVYHGSPHDFDRFELSSRTLGTGEGAQSYGKGLYFAESPDAGRAYQQKLSGRDTFVDGQPFDRMNPYHVATRAVRERPWGNVDDAIGALQYQRKGTTGTERKIYDDAIRLLKHGNGPGQRTTQTHGKLYEVDIDAKPEDFIDWDSPIGAQNPRVRQAIEQGDFPAIRPNEAAGDYLERIGRKTSQQLVDKLQAAGVPGIRYLDQVSREAGKGTRNIVLFDDKLASVVNKSGGPKAPPASPPVKPSGGAPKPPPVQNGFGGSKLPMDEASRMQRAREMGFDVDTPLYHGTPDSRGVWADGFKTPKEKFGSPDPERVYFFAEDQKTASTYADDRRAFDYQNATAETIPVYLRMKNPATVEWNGRPFRGREKDGSGYAIRDYIDKARADGHDGIIIRNVIDTYDGKGKPTTIRAVFDPANIRSVNAAFDPAQSSSSKLLNGFADKATLASAGGGIAYGELGPLEDLNNDGVKDEKDRAAMRIKYGMGGIMTPLLVRGGVGMAKSAGNKLRGGKAAPDAATLPVQNGFSPPRKPSPIDDELLLRASRDLTPGEFEAWKAAREGLSNEAIATRVGGASGGSVGSVMAQLSSARAKGYDVERVVSRVRTPEVERAIELKIDGLPNRAIAERVYPDKNTELAVKHLKTTFSKNKAEIEARREARKPITSLAVTRKPPAQSGFGGGNGPKAPPVKKPPGYGKVRLSPGVEVLPPDRNALKPNPRKAGKAYPMPPSESAELIAARKELRDAKAANTRARNRFVMRENREQLWAEADARETRAMDNVNRILEEQAAKRQKSGRARDAYHATKDFVYSERGGLVAGAAGAAGTVGLVGLGAALMGGSGEKKKPKGVLAPTDPAYFITNLKGNKDNLAAVQGALVDAGLLADGDDDGNWGKRTSDAIDAWLSRQPDRNANLPLQDYEVPALLAEAYGGYQDADGKWYYDDGQPIRFPVPNTRGDMADRTLTPTEVRRMRYEERIRKQKAAAQ